MKLQFDGFDSKGRVKIKLVLDDPLENYTAIQTDFRIAFPEYAADIDQIGDTLYLPSMLFLQKELFSVFAKRNVPQQEYAAFINQLIEKGIPVNKVTLLEQKEFESKEQQDELSIKFNDATHLAYMELLRISRQMELGEDEITRIQDDYNSNKPMFELSNGETSYSLKKLIPTNDGRLIASVCKGAEDYEYFLFLYDQNGNILKARYSNAPRTIIQVGAQFLMINRRCQVQLMDADLNVVSQNYSRFDFRDIKNLNDQFLCIDNHDDLIVIPREQFNHLLENNEEAVERFVVPVPTSYSALKYGDNFIIPKPNMIVRLVEDDNLNHLAFIQFQPKNINSILILPEGNSVPNHIDDHVVVLQKTDDSCTAFWQDEKRICHRTLDLSTTSNDLQERLADIAPDQNNEIRDPDFVRFITLQCISMFQVQTIVPLTKTCMAKIHDLRNGTFAVAYQGGDRGDTEVEIRDGVTGKLIKCHKINDFGAEIVNMQFISEDNTLVCMASAEDKTVRVKLKTKDGDMQSEGSQVEDAKLEDEKAQPILTDSRFRGGLEHLRKNIAFLDLASGQVSRRIAYTAYDSHDYFCVVNGKAVMSVRFEIEEDKFDDDYCIHFMDPEYTRRYHAAVRKEILRSIHEPTGLDPDTMKLVADFVGTDELNYPDRDKIRQSVRSWPAVSFMAKRVPQSGDAEDEQVDDAISTAVVIPSKLQIS